MRGLLFRTRPAEFPKYVDDLQVIFGVRFVFPHASTVALLRREQLIQEAFFVSLTAQVLSDLLNRSRRPRVGASLLGKESDVFPSMFLLCQQYHARPTQNTESMHRSKSLELGRPS